MDVVGMIRRHPGRTAAVAVLGLAVAVAGFLWFRPDRLFTDDAVNEALPGQAAVPAQAEGVAAAPGEEPAPDAGPVMLAAGGVLFAEHETTGRGPLLENPDGARRLPVPGLEDS